jgi:hypothetical protein
LNPTGAILSSSRPRPTVDALAIECDVTDEDLCR